MSLRRTVSAIQTFLRQRREALDFHALKDPRRRRGRRWTLGALVSTAVLSLMMLARSLREAERISRDLADAQRRRGIRRRVPDSTLGDLLAKLPVAPVRRHLHEHVLAEHRRKALEPTVLPIRFASIDGKTVATLDEEVNRHCQRQEQDGLDPVWLYRVVRATLISPAAAVCIDQASIPAATNDAGVFPSFFRQLRRTYGRCDLFEGVFTDAGFTSEANARLVDEAGLAYVMALKDNQPSLRQEAERLFGALTQSSAPEAETNWELDSSRGWIRRQLWRTAEMAGWNGWSHLRQVWLVRVLARDGKDGPVRVLEDRFFLTNMVPGRLGGLDILHLVRAHWRIENDCYGALDVQWHEDHGHWVRRGHGLEVVSLLRVLAYNLLALLRASHLRSAEARRAAWWQLRDWVRDALLWPARAHDADLPEVATNEA
jgi:hypothetical protein